MHWQCRNRVLDLARPVVMGILNVTPDSFSDGNRHAALDAALARAAQIEREGAAIVDVGGESTRPGSLGVSAEMEMGRVIPVIEGIAAASRIAISIDTSKPEVMAAAVRAGAVIINDVNALRAPGAREIAAESRAGVCLMHMKGEPRTMQDDPQYDDVIGEVSAYLDEQRQACIRAGVARDAIALDPGVGFGKGLEHNLTLLKELERLAALGAPLVVGVSRKSFIGRILGRPVGERLYGGLGLASLAVAKGARIIRTHDVAATREAIVMVAAVLAGGGTES
ncbi:MAG TPA: dihydropteroate synthase [Steroidobacteraceae bacterium]|nr:dihydropteroate synthase [Steroidobacteraceae bacterium]